MANRGLVVHDRKVSIRLPGGTVERLDRLNLGRGQAEWIRRAIEEALRREEEARAT